MLPCLFNTEQHEILSGGELMVWCRRTVPPVERERFFLYHHRIANTFVIGRWAEDRELGIFTDFLHIGKSLGDFTREKAREFTRRLYSPTSATETAKIIEQSSRDYKTTRLDEDAGEKERVDKSQRG